MNFELYTGVHDLTLYRVYADVVRERREQVVHCWPSQLVQSEEEERLFDGKIQHHAHR